MKTILALVTALSLASASAQTGAGGGTAYRSDSGMINIASQNQEAKEGQRHMVEFNTLNIPSLVFALQKSKTKGTESDNDSSSSLNLNYAYTVHPNVQVGGRFNYFNGIFANNDVERMDVQVGGWFNSKAGDLKNSAYLSAHLGTGWAQTFGDRGGRDDLWLLTGALGKRTSLEHWGLNHVSWTPEVALVQTNSTNNSSFDYRQALEFRLLQFSVLW